MALARGQLMQATLLNGAADTAASAWSDVQLMLAQAPAVTHLLCIPFGTGGSSEQAGPACQHHAGSSSSGAGALLFGFAAAPQLDERRKAALAVLAQCLPAPMARLSGDTLAFVNFATGSSQRCSCCCSADEEEEEEEEEAGTTDRCAAPGRPNGRGDDGAAPSQALHVPRTSDDCAGPSCVHGDDILAKKLLAAAAAAAAGGNAQRDEGAPLEEPKLSLQLSSPRLSGSDDLSSGPSSPTSSLRFSKALVRAAEEQGAAVTQQSPLTLTFRSPLAEAEYGRWIGSLYYKVRRAVGRAHCLRGGRSWLGGPRCADGMGCLPALGPACCNLPARLQPAHDSRRQPIVLRCCAACLHQPPPSCVPRVCRETSCSRSCCCRLWPSSPSCG